MAAIPVLSAVVLAVFTGAGAAQQPPTGPNCTDTPVPAFLPLRNATLVQPALLDSCPDELARRPAPFWNATLCCSRAPSPALASALVAGFAGSCSSQCAFNPASAAVLAVAINSSAAAAPGSSGSGSPLLGWRWNATAACWEEEAEAAPLACNVSSLEGEAAVERAVFYLQQAVMADWLLSPELNSSFPGLLAARQQFMGRPDDADAADWKGSQKLEAAWQEALLEALSSNASFQALSAVAVGSPIASLQAELKAEWGPGEWMCEDASVNRTRGIYNPAPSEYAPCLCGKSSEPFLWCYAAYGRQLWGEAADAFDAILKGLEDDKEPSLASQLQQGEAKPEAAVGASRRLQKASFSCSSPALDLVKEPSFDSFIAFIAAASATEAKCELCFPLWKPLMACVSLGTDGETALQAVAVARGQVPLKGFEGATGDTCTNDPLAGKSAESIQKDVEGASVKLELKVCIDVSVVDPKSGWGQAVRLMGTKTRAGLDKEYDKQACFASAGATYKPALQTLELDVNTGVLAGGGKYSGGMKARAQATVQGLAMMKLADAENTPACQYAARSKALYEAVACREYCRYRPGAWQRLRIGLVFGVEGVISPIKITYINLKARMPPCLKPSCPGQEQAADPDPGTGCTPTTFQKLNEFYWPSYGDLPCSLATTTGSGYLAELKDVATVVDCCKACNAKAGCTAYNYCAEPDGCGVPAVAGGTNGSHCYLYAVPTALDWARHLVGGGCNMGVLGTWWSGMLQAKPSITKGCPPRSGWRHNDLFMPTGSVCSLGTLGSFDAVAFQLTDVEDCCAACASTDGCTAWNWCSEDFCFVPGNAAFGVGATKGDCFMYRAVNYTTWADYRQRNRGCGKAIGWWTGHIDAGAPNQPNGTAQLAPHKCLGAQAAPDPCPPLDYRSCCACRRVRADVPYTHLWDATGDPSTNKFWSEPDCGSRLLALPGGTIVDYLGGKLFGFDRSWCPPADYAEVVVDREGEAWVGWVKASDLVFCAERSCGTAVELGAACGGTTACCNLTADGGQAGAACLTQARSTPYGYGASNAACSVPKLQYTAGQEFVLAIKTADARDAGTDAQIWAQLQGKLPLEEGQFFSRNFESEFVQLDNPGADDFQTGSISEFKVSAEAAQEITAVVLFYHKAGWLPAWKPEWVQVRWPNGTSSNFTREPDWRTGSVEADGWIDTDGVYTFVPPNPSAP